MISGCYLVMPLLAAAAFQQDQVTIALYRSQATTLTEKESSVLRKLPQTELASFAGKYPNFVFRKVRHDLVVAYDRTASPWADLQFQIEALNLIPSSGTLDAAKLAPAMRANLEGKFQGQIPGAQIAGGSKVGFAWSLTGFLPTTRGAVAIDHDLQPASFYRSLSESPVSVSSAPRPQQPMPKAESGLALQHTHLVFPTPATAYERRLEAVSLVLEAVRDDLRKAAEERNRIAERMIRRRLTESGLDPGWLSAGMRLSDLPSELQEQLRDRFLDGWELSGFASRSAAEDAWKGGRDLAFRMDLMVYVSVRTGGTNTLVGVSIGSYP